MHDVDELVAHTRHTLYVSPVDLDWRFPVRCNYLRHPWGATLLSSTVAWCSKEGRLALQLTGGAGLFYAGSSRRKDRPP